MKKFMKYEIKGTYKFILGIISIIILASSIIQFNIFNEMKNLETSESINLFRFMFMISILVIFGAFITSFFYIVGSFRKELYEDRGYLTFAIPLTGNQIVGSKLLVALMWNIVIGVVTLLYNAILGIILFQGEIGVLFESFIRIVDLGFATSIITSIISAIISVALTLILIYFSISLSKVTIKNKKIGGMWFIIFLILSGVTSYLTSKIGVGIPYYLDMNTLKVTTIGDMGFSGMVMGLVGMNNQFHPGYINIASFVSEILFGIAFFMGTGYLIEEKIEL